MLKRSIAFIAILLSSFIMLTACLKNIRKPGVIPSFEGFSSQEIAQLAQYGNISILKETNFDTIDTTKYKIIYIEVSQNDKSKIISSILKYFNKADYQVFYTSLSIDNSLEKVCLLKSKDKYDVLRAFKTNGTNYDIDTDTLIEKLKVWDGKYSITINGVDGDWIDISFENLPDNIDEFANEIYNFCPDSVDQGIGDINELVNVIRNDKEIVLWWD